MRYKHVILKPQNRFEAILDGHAFHWFVSFLIVSYAVILGLEVSPQIQQDYAPYIATFNFAIILFFSIEIVLRILAGGKQFFKKWLDILDFFAVSSALIFHAPELLSLRLIRLIRSFLLIELSPRMVHLIHGLRHAIPSLIQVTIIFLVLFYISSLIAVSLFQHPEIEHFQNMGVAMKAMFQTLTGDDWYNILRGVERFYPNAWIFFFSYYVIVVFTILNLFIAVVVTALQAVAEEFESHSESTMNPTLLAIKRLEKEILALKSCLPPKDS